jgi:hypothetical protein
VPISLLLETLNDFRCDIVGQWFAQYIDWRVILKQLLDKHGGVHKLYHLLL